jgi:uncharacterized protein
MLLNLALLLLTVYGAIVALVFVFQRQLLYFPHTERPEPWFAARSQLAFWPSATDYQGLIGQAPEGNSLGTVLVFHGNGGRAIERADYVEALTPRGFRVILVEYPGYGGRPGETNQATLIEAGRRAVRQARASLPGPVYLWGESLGAGVAAAVVADTSLDVAGLVLITPWDALPDVAQRTYPLLPARFLVLDRFDSIANLKGYKKPIAVLLAENDEVIPTPHGQRLYDSFSRHPHTYRRVFPGVGHNTWPSGKNEPWWDEVLEFLRQPDV